MQARTIAPASACRSSPAATMLRCFAVAIALLAATVLQPARAAEDEFLEPEKAFRFSARPHDAKSVEVTFAIAPGYYLYREQFKFAADRRRRSARRRSRPARSSTTRPSRRTSRPTATRSRSSSRSSRRAPSSASSSPARAAPTRACAIRRCRARRRSAWPVSAAPAPLRVEPPPARRLPASVAGARLDRAGGRAGTDRRSTPCCAAARSGRSSAPSSSPACCCR